jgi:hypothetical protein
VKCLPTSPEDTSARLQLANRQACGLDVYTYTGVIRAWVSAGINYLTMKHNLIIVVALFYGMGKLWTLYHEVGLDTGPGVDGMPGITVGRAE